MATYLELVNSVLKRLRETQVGSITENALSTLIGEFVNDAKRKVEDSWQWNVLQDSFIFQTIAGTSSYDIEDYSGGNWGIPKDRTRLMKDPQNGNVLIEVIDSGKEKFIPWQDQDAPNGNKILRQQYLNQNVRGIPIAAFAGWNSTALAGNTQLRLFLVPVPDIVYNIRIYVTSPQADLVATGDVLRVPKDPVIQLAYLYALYERGEELGEMLTMASQKAQDALADAIAFDQSIVAWQPTFTNN